MNNRYERRSDAVAIFAKGKSDGVMYEVTIDAFDLCRVASVPATWWVSSRTKRGHTLRYAVCEVCWKGKKEYASMHRVILLPDDGVPVDHRDGDGLNNRRSNLRTGVEVNSLNRHRASPHSRTGVRGVGVYYGTTTRYSAQVTAFGKRHWLGMHATVEAAEAAVKKLLNEFGI